MVIALLLLALWTTSLFSFAGWRLQIIWEKGIAKGILRDWIFQAYLKGSGIVILFVILELISRV